MDVTKPKLEAIIARSGVNKKRLRKVNENVGNCGSASDRLTVGRAVARVAAAAPPVGMEACTVRSRGQATRRIQ